MVATIAKMAVPSYYIESQAAHEGYYTGGGKERPGEWYNPTGLFRLKDGGLVWEKKFYALCGGRSPELDGTDLVRNAGSEKRSPGFDITFSADKSISALWAISPRAEDREKIERAVIDAARCALDETVFRHCATTRVGKAGVDLRIETGDMLAATFLHRTSREGDPQLHVHSTIFNVVKTHSDGKFRALHGYPLYSWTRAAGAAFRGHLAHIMQERLGIAMERHGHEGRYSRIREMDEDLEQLWSKRRAQIVATVAEHLGEEALYNPAQMAAATLATRSRKPEGGPTTEEDIERFLEEAAELVDVAELRDRIRNAGIEELTHERIAEIHDEIVAIPEKLARMDAVFNVPNILEQLDNALAGAVDREAMQRWREVALGNADLVSLEYPEPAIEAQAGMAHKQIFTTKETLRAERTLRHVSGLSVSDRTHAVDPDKVARLLEDLGNRGKRFSAEQRRAVQYAAAESGRIALIEGAAGAGKSHVLGPLADLWRAEGYKVRALAVAWSVARELAGDIDAPPSAVHPFLKDVHKGAVNVGPDTVLVVDEAGMLSTRQTLQLARLSEETGCKLLLVGDTQQQQPIEAGPGMRIVKQRVKGVRIDRIRRQLPTVEDYLREIVGLPAEEAIEMAASMTREERDAASKRYTAMRSERRAAGEEPLSIKRPWQLGVSALLRTGAMHQAFIEIHKRGRFTLAEGKEDALLRLVAHWSAWMAENPDGEAVVMARTRADVRALNALLRARHHGANAPPDYNPATDSAVIRIHRFRDRGKAVEDDLEVRIGDRLRIGATVSRLGLYNRDAVTVTGLEKQQAEDGRTQVRITARTQDNRTVRFEPGDIRNWIGEIAIDYAYAATCTAAQGLTIDAGFLLLDEGMARETTYPAATRHTRHLQVVADRLPVAIAIAGATPDGEPGHEVSDEEIVATLGRLCGRSQPKQAAIDYILAANQADMPLQGELEIGREPVPAAEAANDAVQPGTAGAGPRSPGEPPGAAVRRHADRAAVQRILAEAKRQIPENAARAEAVALAADMEEVEEDWARIAADPAPSPDLAPQVQHALDRHRQVLRRVRVFLRNRNRTRGKSDSRDRTRVSDRGLERFARLRRNMRGRWRDTLNEAEAERTAEALDRDWKELRSRVGPDPLAFLEEPEHAVLVRRTAELAGSRTAAPATARDWRAFLDEHFTSLSLELWRVWNAAHPGAPERNRSARDVAAYRTLLRQAHTTLATFRCLTGRNNALELQRWRDLLVHAPTYREALGSLARSLDNEEKDLRRRETKLAGSTLPTRRLADHMANLGAAARLPGFRESQRKTIRRFVRQHRQARKEAGVTRTDAPWPTDGQIERRIETGRELREGWRRVREVTRDDPLAALDYLEARLVIERSAEQALDPSLDADTARERTAFLVRELQQLDTALEAARTAVRAPTASPGWSHAEFEQYARLWNRAAAFTRTLTMLPDGFAVPSVPGGKWQDWLSATPNTREASDMLLRSIRAEEAAIRDRETVLPGYTLLTRRLHDHMETLEALTGPGEDTALRSDGERRELRNLLESWVEAREAAGVTRTDVRWLSDSEADQAAARRAEGRALNKAWREFRTGDRPVHPALLDQPDHGSLIARTAAFALDLEDRRPETGRKWRELLETHLQQLARQLNDAFESIAGSSDRSARNVEQFNRYFRLPRRVDALADMLAAVPPAMTQPVDFDLQDWKRRLAEAPSGDDVYERLVEDLFEEERIVTEREDGLPGSTLPTRRLGEHMAVLEALISSDVVGAGDKEYFRGLLDAHRQARADAGVTVADLPWPDTPELQVEQDYRRIREAVERAAGRASDSALINEPGIEALGPEAARLLATPWLSADGRRYLDKFQDLIDTEIRQRNDVSGTIERARAHLQEYPAILDRALAPKPPEPAPDDQDTRPGLFGRVRRLLGAEDDIPARPADPAPAPQALNDFDPDYRKWDVQAEQLVKRFRNWRATAKFTLRDFVDRRWIDMADLIAEFEAIRSAARDPKAEPYRIETPDAGAFAAADQRHDPDRLATLMRDVIRPEDERSSEAVLELARRNRAWPDETLAVFRRHARQAAAAGETRSLSRLAAGLPRNLTRSLTNLSEVTWQHQGEDIDRRREREQGYDRSM